MSTFIPEGFEALSKAVQRLASQEFPQMQIDANASLVETLVWQKNSRKFIDKTWHSVRSGLLFGDLQAFAVTQHFGLVALPQEVWGGPGMEQPPSSVTWVQGIMYQKATPLLRLPPAPTLSKVIEHIADAPSLPSQDIARNGDTGTSQSAADTQSERSTIKQAMDAAFAPWIARGKPVADRPRQVATVKDIAARLGVDKGRVLAAWHNAIKQFPEIDWKKRGRPGA